MKKYFHKFVPLKVHIAVKKNIFIFILLYSVLSVNASNRKFITRTFSDQVKTLQVNVMDEPLSAPIIELEGGQWVEVSFDILEQEPHNYTYKLIHCDADWNPSQLVQSEYMRGFQNRIIEDYSVSFNTTMNYVHYRITFPNEDIYLRVSGNYVVEVFPENSNAPILSACFSVVEPNSVPVSMRVTPQTDKGMNTSYQQVNFDVGYGNEVKSPLVDLKVYVRQNNRFDNEVAQVKPLMIQNNRIVFEHVPALIFDGGNEYRSFEMITHQYNGLNIENIEFHSPYYHVILNPDLIRSQRPYSFMQDINGNFVIRTLSGTDYSYEADYQIVHFYLPCEKPFSDKVYILGELFNNILDERSQMDYSVTDKGYVKTVLLKEGYYNYLYVTKRNEQSPANIATVEGNFFQTENEYRVMVYFRPMGGRYDRLIGVKTIQFK
jgi:hypothetical protein